MHTHTCIHTHTLTNTYHSAKLMRNLSIVSYFSLLVSMATAMSHSLRNFLQSVPPLEVPWSDITVHVLHRKVALGRVDPAELWMQCWHYHCLNGGHWECLHCTSSSKSTRVRKIAGSSPNSHNWRKRKIFFSTWHPTQAVNWEPGLGWMNKTTSCAVFH